MTEKLLMIADKYPSDPRWVALSVLEVWWGGYAPEPGLASYVDTAGSHHGVIPEIARRITEAGDLLTRIAGDTPATAAPAAALLTVIPLGWGTMVDEQGLVQSWGARVSPDGTVHFPERETK